MAEDVPYPHLAQLLGGYFHQDWSEDHVDETAVLDDFVATNWAETIEATASDIRRFLVDHRTDTLAAIERTFIPDIIVGSDDEEARGWLCAVAAKLDRNRDQAPAQP